MFALRTVLIPFYRPLNIVPRYSSTRIEWLPFEKKKYLRRKGYEAHIHEKGLLPRIPNDPGPLPRMIHENPMDEWNENEALFGQNDYIDILGDGDIHPARLLTNMPWWLRAFRGNELQMINRQRHGKRHFYETRPAEWDRMKKRADYLYNWINRKKRPPRPIFYR